MAINQKWPWSLALLLSLSFPKITPAEDFVPLLAPPVIKKTPVAQSSNIFHGRIRTRNYYQSIDTTQVFYRGSRLDSDGGLDRINGGPWSFIWSGNLSYRDGNTFSSANDFQDVEPHLYRTMMSRKFGDSGFIRIGRIFSSELSGLGYVDGSHLERSLKKNFRFGLAAGVKPSRRDLSFSGDEAVGSGYGTFETGERGKFYYTGTLGFFHTLFKGQPDQLAAVYDQRMDLGKKLNLYGNVQVDFNAGAARVKETPRFTRVDVYAVSPLFSFLSVKGGANHYERPDTAAERNLTGVNNLASFDKGFWRYWGGSSQYLPWDLQLDEEVSVLKSSGIPTESLWRASINRRGFLFLPDSQIRLTVFNLAEAQEEGYGGSAYLFSSLINGKVFFSITGNYWYSSEIPNGDKTFKTIDYSAQAFYRVSRSWTIDLNFTRNYQGGIDSSLIDGSLTYRW